MKLGKITIMSSPRKLQLLMTDHRLFSNSKSALDSLRSETEKQAHARSRLVAEIKRDIEVRCRVSGSQLAFAERSGIGSSK